MTRIYELRNRVEIDVSPYNGHLSTVCNSIQHKTDKTCSLIETPLQWNAAMETVNDSVCASNDENF